MASHRQAVRQCARWPRTRVTTRSLPPTAAASHASARTSPAPSARSIVQNDKRTKSNGRTQHQGLFRQNCLGLALNGFALLPGLRVAVPDLPYLEEITHREFPRLAIVPLPLGRSLDFFTGRGTRRRSSPPCRTGLVPWSRCTTQATPLVGDPKRAALGKVKMPASDL